MDDGKAKESAEFGINKSYAQNYNRWRRKEELQKFKDKYGVYDEDDDSSSSETEDEDAEGLTPQVEKDFFKTLSIIKSRDPKMYTKDAKFYESEDSEDEEASSSDGPKQKKESSKKDKPMYLKDYERKIIVEKEGKFTDDLEDEDQMEDSAGEHERAMSPSYAEEQQRLKDSFFSAVHDIADDDDDEEDEGIFTVKKKSKSEEEEEEKEYVEWLKGAKDTLSKDDAETAQLDPLRKYWTDPSLDDGEKFLRDFILNKGYIDKDTTGGMGFHLDDDDDEEDDETEGEEEDGDFSEEERQLEEQEDFERKYNFRYEEPDSEFIKRYPRMVGESVRRKDTSRAEKRQEKKSRQEQDKQKKREELKHLKNLKKQEIMERIDKLKEVTGNETIGFDPDDLEGDFDPSEHDRLMQKVFSGEYEGHEEHVKPQFTDEEELQEENWDEWMRKNQDAGEAYDEGQKYQNYDEEYDEGDEAHYEEDDGNFNMDADYMDPSQRREVARWNLADEMLGVSRKKRKKMSMFAKSLVKKKPVFNPEDKTFEDYIEEYYRLDYEDMIGDLPCRFKYRNVPANSFGLSTEEILRSREKELNQWASLKKTCQYRSEDEEKRDIALFQKMGQNEAKKKRIFLSMQEESDMEENMDNDNSESRTKPQGKRKAARVQKGNHEPTENGSRSSSGKQAAGSGKRKKAPQTTPGEGSSETKKVRVQETEQSVNGKAVPKLSGPKPANTQRLPETGATSGEQRTEFKDNRTVSSSKSELSSREKKKQRKREILAKLKGLKKRKKVKRLQGMRGRIKVGSGTVSEARLRAYGINPKKHHYRMKNEAAKRK